MGERIRLRAEDDHEFAAYLAVPKGEIRGGLVIIQEIFGVNSHIRSMVDGFGRYGMLTVAPALFDRVERDIELGYEGPGVTRGMALKSRLKLEDALRDIAAALNYVAERTGNPAGVVGYCFGGTLAWLSAVRLRPAAAVCYYGGNISKFASEKPHCPVMMHFGTKDVHIPKADVDRIQKLHPEIPLYRYDAGHGFNCNDRASFDELSSVEAFERTLSFLRDHLG